MTTKSSHHPTTMKTQEGKQAPEQIELLPCPFCGSTDSLAVAFYNRPCVVCSACDADGPGPLRLTEGDNKDVCREAAINAWNKRATSAPDLLAALKDAVPHIEFALEQAQEIASKAESFRPVVVEIQQHLDAARQALLKAERTGGRE